MSNNRLANLQVEIGNLTQLTTLNLSNNQLTELPEEIEKLTNLRILNLRENPISADEIRNIERLLPLCHVKR